MITQEDLSTIVAAVLDALQTNGKTIAQLTATTELSEDDYIEVSGGKKVSYETLRDAIAAACGGGEGGTVEYDGSDEVTQFDYAQNTGVVTLKQKSRTSKTFTIPTATTSKRGLMSSTDKTTLATASANADTALASSTQAFNKASQALTALGGKADLQSSTLAPMLKTTQWPDVMVYNITPLWYQDAGYDWSSIPVGSIYLEDTIVNNVGYRKLYFKSSVSQEGIVDLGAPREGTIYCHKGHGTTYVWDTSAAEDGLGAFVQIGLYPAANGRLAYKLMAPMVLASMGRTLDNVGNSGAQFIYSAAVGDTYFSDGVIYYKKSSTNTVNLGEPDKSMIFCNKQTNRLYRWNGSSMTELGNS